MRKVFLVLLLAMLVAAAIAWFIRLDAGYVLIQFHGYSVETSFWVALLLLLLGGGVIWAALQLLSGLFALLSLVFGLPASGPLARMRLLWTARRRRAADRGVIEFYRGRWRPALRHLARTANQGDSALVYQLLASRSAEELGDQELAESFLDLADQNEDAAAVVAIARAEMLARRGADMQALALVDAISPDPATHPAAARLQLELCARLGHWERVSARMADMRRFQVMPAPSLDQLEERACLALLETAAGAGAGLDGLRKTWQSMSARVRARSALMLSYASHLNRLGGGADAERLLADSLRIGFEDAIADLWGQCRAERADKQLATGEKLLEQYPDNATLLLAVGRVAIRNQLWGKARDYLNASAARGRAAEAGAALATLPASAKA